MTDKGSEQSGEKKYLQIIFPFGTSNKLKKEVTDIVKYVKGHEEIVEPTGQIIMFSDLDKETVPSELAEVTRNTIMRTLANRGFEIDITDEKFILTPEREDPWGALGNE